MSAVERKAQALEQAWIAYRAQPPGADTQAYLNAITDAVLACCPDAVLLTTPEVVTDEFMRMIDKRTTEENVLIMVLPPDWQMASAYTERDSHGHYWIKVPESWA
jgi:hypothetical protein